jgi:replicative DNA helicase
MTAVDVGRQPPQDLEAEMSLLGGLLLEQEAIGQVLQVIPREESHHFYRPDHRRIYEVLIELYDQNKPIDVIVLRDELARRNLLEEVGGVEYLVALTESVPSAANCEHYAGIVRDKGLLRELIRATGNVLDAAYDQRQKTADLLDRVEKELFEVTERRIRGKVLHLRDILEEAYRRIAEHDGRLVTGVPTGFTELNEYTSGFQPGEFIVIAARPSMGKTALALSMAEAISIDEGIPSAVFSLEMSKQQIALRMLSSRSGVEAHNIRRGRISDEQRNHLFQVCGQMCEKPIFVDDTAGMTVMELRAKARRLRQQHRIEIVFVDYLQLLSEPKAARESRQQEISSISRALKALARELTIPVVAMAQLNRDPEKREGNRPRMSDLRESGAIEQDADVVILLHREEYFQEQKARKGRGDSSDVEIDAAVDPAVRGKAELIIAKQRNGPTGVVEVHFEKRLTRFGDLHHGADMPGYAAVAAPPPVFDNATPDESVPF